MDGSLIRFFVAQGHHLHGLPTWQWMLSTANKLGLRGGSAFHAMAGFGRRHVMHEDRFFELGGSLIIEVEFIVTPPERQVLLDRLAEEDLHLFYAETPATFGELVPAKEPGARA